VVVGRILSTRIFRFLEGLLCFGSRLNFSGKLGSSVVVGCIGLDLELELEFVLIGRVG